MDLWQLPDRLANNHADLPRAIPQV